MKRSGCVRQGQKSETNLRGVCGFGAGVTLLSCFNITWSEELRKLKDHLCNEKGTGKTCDGCEKCLL